ncbi:AlpA family transcriptional regulator, partial [Enterobacter sp. CGMCC 5087]
MTTPNTNNASTTSTTQLCAEDPLIDMTFITTFTGMTDKWFYKLI